MKLSPQQTRICELLAQGFTDKQIGNVLKLSENTVGVHLARLFKKVELHTRYGVAIWYLATKESRHGRTACNTNVLHVTHPPSMV